MPETLEVPSKRFVNRFQEEFYFLNSKLNLNIIALLSSFSVCSVSHVILPVDVCELLFVEVMIHEVTSFTIN